MIHFIMIGFAIQWNFHRKVFMWKLVVLQGVSKKCMNRISKFCASFLILKAPLRKFFFLCKIELGIYLIPEADMRILFLGSGSIFVNLSGSSPNLKIFEANYEL